VVRGAILLVSLLILPAAPAGRTLSERLKPQRLEAVRQQRLEWIKQRRDGGPAGVYRDFRALVGIDRGIDPEWVKRTIAAGIEVLLLAGTEPKLPGEGDLTVIPGTIDDGGLTFRYRGRSVRLALEDTEAAASAGGMAIFRSDSEAALQAQRFREYPLEALGASVEPSRGALERWRAAARTRAFAGVAVADLRGKLLPEALRIGLTHILARDATPGSLLDSLAAARTYVAHEWLCETGNFWFRGVNALGVYEIGDRMPLLGRTRLLATLPVPAKIRLYRDGQPVAEANSRQFAQEVAQPGAYHLEAALLADGEQRPWIYTNPVYVAPAPADLLPPERAVAPTHADVAYGAEPRQKLDLYLPPAASPAPLVLFLHGGNWRAGDKARYQGLAGSLRDRGLAVALANYRFDSPEAQLSDARLLVAWARAHAAAYGANPELLFLAGHSAGGHLAALAALEEGLKPLLAGVIAVSGIYDVRGIAHFGSSEMEWSRFSPLYRDAKDAPAFLIVHAQFEPEGYPLQAREFYSKVRRGFASAQLKYLEGENHLSAVFGEARALAREIAAFVESRR
jgi:acetyl esterase/lipase